MDYRTSKLKKEDHIEVLPTVQTGDVRSGIEIKVMWIHEFKELRLHVNLHLDAEIDHNENRS